MPFKGLRTGRGLDSARPPVRGAFPFLAAFLLLSPASAAAQTEAIPRQLTLAAALRIAEARNPAFRAARQGVDVARAEVLAARRGPNPEVAFEGEAYPVFGGRRPSPVCTAGACRARGEAGRAAATGYTARG